MSFDREEILADEETKQWFWHLEPRVAEGTAALAAVRSLVVCLAQATRRPQFDLHHWTKTHNELRLAVQLTLKELYPHRLSFDGESEFLNDLETEQLPLSLHISTEFANLSLEHANRLLRENWFEAIRFSALALSPLTEDTQGSVSTWRYVVEHAKEDAQDLEARSLRDVMSSPLFAEKWLKESLLQTVQFATSRFANDPKEGPRFEFWRRWYKGLVVGQPLTWDITSEIAALPYETWQGETALADLAQAIREIEAKHHLLTEITDLRAQMEEMRRSVQAPAQGHNQGPPLDDVAATQIPRQFDLVWPILDSLEEETRKEAPDPSRLQALALALWEIAQKIVSYCGGVLDRGLKKAAETLGEEGTKWTIRVLAAEAMASNSGVQSVAKAAWKFAQTLGGG